MPMENGSPAQQAKPSPGLVVLCERGFRRQPRLIENCQYWCGLRGIRLSIIDHEQFYAGDWGMPKESVGAFYLPIAEHYDPIVGIPGEYPVIVDFDANGSSNLPALDLSRTRYALRNAFGIRLKANRPPEFQVPYINRPMAISEAGVRDVIIFDVKPFHALPAQAAALTLIAGIAHEYGRICDLAGHPVYLYFSSFMPPAVFMEAMDAFVRDASIYVVGTNPLRQIEHAILPPAREIGDYHKLMQRCRLFVTEHGDLADIDMIQIGCLGVPILLYKRLPFFKSAGISLQTLEGAAAIEPGIRQLIRTAERERLREEWGMERIFSAGKVTPWNSSVLESLFVKSWDSLWRWAIEGEIDEKVQKAMNTDFEWRLGLELETVPPAISAE
jgi:hypothetical protein